MTREEAIKLLKTAYPKCCKEVNYRLQGGFDDHESPLGQALEMAIKALEQEPVIEIKVGDEVTVQGVKGIVVRGPYPIGADNELFVLIWYGQHMSSNSLKNVAPTGRHFPQITEVLEQLKRSC